MRRAPDDKGIAKELLALRATMKAERQAESRLFKGAFKFTAPARTGEAQGAASSIQGGVPGVQCAAAGGSRRGWMGWLLTLLTLQGWLAFMGFRQARR